jgi:hypothetical protein
MAGDQDGPLPGGEGAKEVAQPADTSGVEPVRRLVEDQHFGIAEQCRCEPEPLPHPERVGLDPTPRRRLQLDQTQYFFDARARQLDRLREHAEMVAAGAAGMEVGRFQHRPDAAARLCEMRLRAVEEKRPAGCRCRKSEQHAKRCRLAGAVRARKSGDRLLLELERKIVDRDNAAEPLRQ